MAHDLRAMNVSLAFALGSGLGFLGGWLGAVLFSATFSARTGIALSPTWHSG
jgi:multidrug transporter EmrE-like cation transporter